MNSRAPKNVVASVLARLRNSAKSSGTPFQQVLQQYAIERFLHRVSKSQHAQSVILKGALLLETIDVPSARPTMDIDMLRKGKADQGSLVAPVQDCATLEVEADGLTFLADSAMAEQITKDSEYKGTRIIMEARMDNVRLNVQIDFGVGDVIVPGPRVIQYPVFLGGDMIEMNRLSYVPGIIPLPMWSEWTLAIDQLGLTSPRKRMRIGRRARRENPGPGLSESPPWRID